MVHSKNHSFAISPSWKQFFTGYVLSVITIPVFGLGLIAFYFIRKKHRQITFKIANTHITRVDEKFEHNVDLVNIEKVELQKTWLQRQLGIGTLVLHTSASKMVLEGLEEPKKLKGLLEQAIQTERKRRQEQEKTKAWEPKYQPGSLDKMDYLTGLWQQGLISEDDYENERKHFE